MANRGVLAACGRGGRRYGTVFDQYDARWLRPAPGHNSEAGSARYTARQGLGTSLRVPAAPTRVPCTPAQLPITTSVPVGRPALMPQSGYIPAWPHMRPRRKRPVLAAPRVDAGAGVWGSLPLR